MRRGIRHVRFNDDDLVPHRRKFRHTSRPQWGINSAQWVLALVVVILWLVGAVELAKVATELHHVQGALSRLHLRFNQTLARIDALEAEDPPTSQVPSATNPWTVGEASLPVVLWPRERISVPLPRQFTDPAIAESGWHSFSLSAGFPSRPSTGRPVSSAIVELTTRVGVRSSATVSVQPPGSLWVRFGSGDGQGAEGEGVVVVRHAPPALGTSAQGTSLVRHHRLVVPVDSGLRLWVSKEDTLRHDSGLVGLEVVGLV